MEGVDQAPVAITLIQPTAVHTPFPQHATNDMAHEPTLPPHQLDPRQVAEAILDAAVNHIGNVKVGAMSTMNTLLHDLLPGPGKNAQRNRRTGSRTTRPHGIRQAPCTSLAAVPRCTAAAAQPGISPCALAPTASAPDT